MTSLSRGTALAVFLLLSTGCSTSFQQRPYRFDLAAPPASATQLVAQRMSRDGETTPVIADPNRGVVLSKWSVIGASASLRLWPPGEDRAWIVERWRAVVIPQGWASMVLVDVERVLCDTQGFRVDPMNLWGRCTPETKTTENGQRRIDAKGAAVATPP